MNRKLYFRAATMDDRLSVFHWLTDSDVTSGMLGPPVFPEIAVPTWKDFCDDYQEHFFDGSRIDWGQSFIIQLNSKAIGHFSYDGLQRHPGTAELDIWMKSSKYCGHGYGTAALSWLTQYLADDLCVARCIIRPSARNPVAIRAYLKAGFSPATDSPAVLAKKFGPGEFEDTVTLIK